MVSDGQKPTIVFNVAVVVVSLPYSPILPPVGGLATRPVSLRAKEGPFLLTPKEGKFLFYSLYVPPSLVVVHR